MCIRDRTMIISMAVKPPRREPPCETEPVMLASSGQASGAAAPGRQSTRCGPVTTPNECAGFRQHPRPNFLERTGNERSRCPGVPAAAELPRQSIAVDLSHTAERYLD